MTSPKKLIKGSWQFFLQSTASFIPCPFAAILTGDNFSGNLTAYVRHFDTMEPLLFEQNQTFGVDPNTFIWPVERMGLNAYKSLPFNFKAHQEQDGPQLIVDRNPISRFRGCSPSKTQVAFQVAKSSEALKC